MSTSAEISYETMKALFDNAKENYSILRSLERSRIVAYLNKDKNFADVKGNVENFRIKNYTSGGTLSPSYNNSNWKWITGQCNGVDFFLSLQTFDIDKSSHNIHALLDRIGLYLYKNSDQNPEKITIDKVFSDNGKNIRVADYFVRMKKTEFELPLSDGDLKELAAYIKKETREFSP